MADHLVEVRNGRVTVHGGVDEAVLSPSFQGGTASAAPGPPPSTSTPAGSKGSGASKGGGASNGERGSKGGGASNGAATSKKDAATKRVEAEQRQRRSADTKPLRARVQKAERALAKAETAVADLNRQLADPEVYADPERATPLATEFGDAKDRAAAAMDEWMAAAEALEAANG
jgi:ATP-binding cassette subfamily F protein 3